MLGGIFPFSMLKYFFTIFFIILYTCFAKAQNTKFPVNKYSGLTLKEKFSKLKSKSRIFGLTINSNYQVFDFYNEFGDIQYKSVFGNTIDLNFRFQPFIFEFEAGLNYLNEDFETIVNTIPTFEATVSYITFPLATPTLQPYIGMGYHRTNFPDMKVEGVIWCTGLNINFTKDFYLDLKYRQLLTEKNYINYFQKASLGFGFRGESVATIGSLALILTLLSAL